MARASGSAAPAREQQMWGRTTTSRAAAEPSAATSRAAAEPSGRPAGQPGKEQSGAERGPVRDGCRDGGETETTQIRAAVHEREREGERERRGRSEGGEGGRHMASLGI